MSDWEQKEWKINRRLQELDEQVDIYNAAKKEIEELEEESYWFNKHVKEINDNLFDNYPNDLKLQSILEEKEEILQQKLHLERSFWEDCKDVIFEEIKRNEMQQEECHVERMRLYEEREGVGI